MWKPIEEAPKHRKILTRGLYGWMGWGAIYGEVFLCYAFGQLA